MREGVSLFIGFDFDKVVFSRNIRADSYDHVRMFHSKSDDYELIKRDNLIYLEGRSLELFLSRVHESHFDSRGKPVHFEVVSVKGDVVKISCYNGFLSFIHKNSIYNAYLHVPFDLFSTDIIDVLKVEGVYNCYDISDVYQERIEHEKKHRTNPLNLYSESRARIIDLLRNSDGMTSKEMSLALGIDMNQVTPRISELSRHRVVKNVGRKDSQSTKHTGKVWGLTDEFKETLR